MAEMQHVKKKDAEKEKNTATLSKISNAIKGSEKLDVEGTDLLELLSHLEGELQARDVAIAALKSEQVNPLSHLTKLETVSAVICSGRHKLPFPSEYLSCFITSPG